MKPRLRDLAWSVAAVLIALAVALVGSTEARVLLSAGPDLYGAAPESLPMAGALAEVETTADALSPAPGGELLPVEARLLDLLNGDRVRRGLQPLRLDPRLVNLARQRSSDMATRHYFSHVTPEGTMVFDMMDRRQIPYRLAGENLARNSFPLDKSPEVAHQMFMDSPKHAENDYDPNFNKIGIGAAVSPTGSIYLTELFAILDQ